jgi:hypothetical protein
MSKPKKNVKDVVQKEYPEFAATVDGLSVADLEKKLSTYAKEQEKVIEAQERDVGLEDAKAKVSELSGPYNDAKKAIRIKMRYLIAIIRDKGGDA